MQIETIELENGFTFNRLSKRVATVKKGKKRVCSYFGFRTKRDAEKFVRAITKRQLCTKNELRKAERLDDWNNWEVKVWGAPTALIQAMAERDLSSEAQAVTA
jgi:hypothetical protein